LTRGASVNYTPVAGLKRGEERSKLQINVGQKIHNYTVTEKKFVPERNITAYYLVHDVTGARHLHIESDDTNNVFCTTFKTTPTDSTGVAHILEHTVLCGSEKYPVRDPFFNMLKRSLNTYMNAWTGGDFTSYPFATQNEKDYYNLLSVYLDATYFPKLEEYDFMQEGHRLELSNPEDLNSALEFKGVVYNEMKGAMSDTSRLFGERLQSNLYPTTTYTNNSGGDPKDIPNLTWKQLREFHKTHYHPSNSYTLTYGDLPLEPILKFIHEEALAKFTRIVPNTDVQDEVRFSQPKEVHATCPSNPMAPDPDKQSKVALAYLTNKITDAYESFVMSFLGMLLTGGPNSPMYQALIDSNIGSSYSPYTGYDASNRESLFSVGLMGVKTEDAKLVTDIIEKTLAKAAQEGFPQERIESILHQIEIAQKHVSTNFGLSLVSALTHIWIHGGNPVSALSLNEMIEKLKGDLNSNIFEKKIKQYLLENPHKLAILMTPDAEYTKRESEEEKNRLTSIKQKLTEKDLQEINERARVLKQRQESVPDPSCLPKIALSDIERTKPKTPIQVETISDVKVQLCKQPTNGISYFTALLDFSQLPADLNIYVPLFCSVLTEVGAGDLSYRDFAQQTELCAGEFSSSTSLVVNHSDVSQFKRSALLRSFSLERNTDKMFELWTKLFNEPKLEDKDRLKTLILNIQADMLDSITSSGHSYAKSWAASFLSQAHYVSETWDGITQFNLIQDIVANIDDGALDKVSEALKQIAQNVLNKNVMRVALNMEEKLMDVNKTRLSKFFETLPARAQTSVNIQLDKHSDLTTRQFFFSIPASINFVAQCFPTVTYAHPDFAKLQVLSTMMSQSFLHREIREKGGAYGGGAGQSSGLFYFYSYRDPNIDKTINSFKGAVDWVLSGRKESANTFSEQNIEEAKLSLFSDIDMPVSPSKKGLSEFLTGITWEMRQQHRERLFGVERADLLGVAEKYLPLAEKGVTTVFGAEEQEKEIQNSGLWVVNAK
jgi:hypothetical protein